MKLERRNENFTKTHIRHLQYGDVFVKDIEGYPILVYQDKDCEVRYLNMKDFTDEDIHLDKEVFVCDAKLAYCIRSSLYGQ